MIKIKVGRSLLNSAPTFKLQLERKMDGVGRALVCSLSLALAWFKQVKLSYNDVTKSNQLVLYTHTTSA
jgi:hypothetical protein